MGLMRHVFATMLCLATMVYYVNIHRMNATSFNLPWTPLTNALAGRSEGPSRSQPGRQPGTQAKSPREAVRQVTFVNHTVSTKSATQKTAPPTPLPAQAAISASTQSYGYFGSAINFLPMREHLKRQKWDLIRVEKMKKLRGDGRVGMVFVNDVPAYKQARTRFPNAIINNLGLKACIWGAKDSQLRCRRSMAMDDGCQFEELNIQPAQFVLSDVRECVRFKEEAILSETMDRWWVTKSTSDHVGSARGLQLLSPEAVYRYLESFSCRPSPTAPRKVPLPIAMEYVQRPALYHGHKFDVRTYVLVASASPMVVLFHKGFARQSYMKYELNNTKPDAHFTNTNAQGSHGDHYLDFEVVQEQLEGLPRDFFQGRFQRRAKKVSLMALHAFWRLLEPEERTWQIFGLDWILDQRGNVFLMESNGFPRIANFAPDLKLTPGIWHTATDLVLNVQTKPGYVEQMVQGFKFADWQLLWNEQYNSTTEYNVCDVFRGDLELSRARMNATCGPGLVDYTANASSCEKLGWEKLVPFAQTCAMMECPENTTVTYQAASELCTGRGGRLCMFDELRDLDVGETLCGEPSEHVWTMSSCGPDAHVSARFGGPRAPKCASDETELAKVMCCANNRQMTTACAAEDKRPLFVDEERILKYGCRTTTKGSMDVPLSKTSCQTLGWAGRGLAYDPMVGTTAFCAEDCHTAPISGNFTDAKAVCREHGARLCTARELVVLQRHEQCDAPLTGTWAGTRCRPNGEFRRYKVVVPNGKSMCVPIADDAEFGHRCCADMEYCMS